MVGFIANTTSFVENAKDLKENPADVGSWISLIGDTVATIGSVLEIIPGGGTLIGKPLSIVGGAVSALGDIFTIGAELNEGEERQNTLLKGIVDDDELRSELVYAAKYDRLNHIQFALGLNAEQIQLLGKRYKYSILRGNSLSNLGEIVRKFNLSSTETASLIIRIGDSVPQNKWGMYTDPINYLLNLFVRQNNHTAIVNKSKDDLLTYLKSQPERVTPQLSALIKFLDEQNRHQDYQNPNRNQIVPY